MRLRSVVLMGVSLVSIAVGMRACLSNGWKSGPPVATLADGRSIPAFLSSIDDRDHVFRWRNEFDVTADFLSYCSGLSVQDILKMFNPAQGDIGKYNLPNKNGRFYYSYTFRQGDMDRLHSYLSRFPLYPTPLEFYVTVDASASGFTIKQAKIIDKTAYP